MTAYLIPILEAMKRDQKVREDVEAAYARMYKAYSNYYYDVTGNRCIDRADQDNRNWEILHDQRNGN